MFGGLISRNGNQWQLQFFQNRGGGSYVVYCLQNTTHKPTKVWKLSFQLTCSLQTTTAVFMDRGLDVVFCGMWKLYNVEVVQCGLNHVSPAAAMLQPQLSPTHGTFSWSCFLLFFCKTCFRVFFFLFAVLSVETFLIFRQTQVLTALTGSHNLHFLHILQNLILCIFCIFSIYFIFSLFCIFCEFRIFCVMCRL